MKNKQPKLDNIPYWMYTELPGRFVNWLLEILLTRDWARRKFVKFNTPDELINVAHNFRKNWIAEKASQIKPNAKILDVGAGQAPYREYFKHCQYTTQDFMLYEGMDSSLSKERWEYSKIDIISDLTDIPVPDSSFKVVLCTEVLEHVPDPINALQEISRILEPEGNLLLTVPMSAGIHQDPYHYYGGFTPQFFRYFLPKFGMSITELTPVCGLFRHVGQEIYRSARVIVANQPQDLNIFQRFLLYYWIPKFFDKEESKNLFEEFTIGYVVEAQKKKGD